MKLKEITFMFENEDSVTIDGKYIGEFLIDGIESYFIRNDLTNGVEKVDVAGLVAIEIHKTANQIMHQFGRSDLEILVFDRIANYNDIICIHFILDDVEYTYYVDENMDVSGLTNEDMETYISWHNNLYIFISNKSKLEYYFDSNVIDADSYQKKFDALISAE